MRQPASRQPTRRPTAQASSIATGRCARRWSALFDGRHGAGGAALDARPITPTHAWPPSMQQSCGRSFQSLVRMFKAPQGQRDQLPAARWESAHDGRWMLHGAWTTRYEAPAYHVQQRVHRSVAPRCTEAVTVDASGLRVDEHLHEAPFRRVLWNDRHGSPSASRRPGLAVARPQCPPYADSA